jgi:VanZ family protein
MTFKKDFIKYWVPVFLWMAFIFWMSTGTFSSENTSRFFEPAIRLLFPTATPQRVSLFHAIFRKAGHVFEYFILGFLLFRAFRAGSSESWNWRWPLSAAVVIILWAASDEFHQSFMPSRQASIQDVGIDIAGGVFAQVAGVWWFYHKKK